MKKMPTTYSAVKCRNYAKTYFDLLLRPNYTQNAYSDVQILSGYMMREYVEKYKKALVDAGFVLELRNWNKVPFYVHPDGATILVGTDPANTGRHIIDFYGAKKAKKVSNYSVYD